VYESDAIVVDLDVITFIPKVLSILEWLWIKFARWQHFAQQWIGIA
jgi:hypothetical protein